jgi:hypothetical protein
MFPDVLVPIIVTALIGGVSMGLTVFFTRKKSEAEGELFEAKAADVLTRVALRQLEYLEGKITTLIAEVTLYRGQIELALGRELALAKRVTLLETALMQNNIPIPKGLS